MAVMIKVTKTITETDDTEFRLQVYVSYTASNVPPEIFVHKTDPSLPESEQENRTIRFVKVCTYADMLNYPAISADSATVLFRRKFIDLLFVSKLALQTFWAATTASIQDLVDDIAATHEATPEETVTDVT